MSDHNPDMPATEVALARAENALGELGFDPGDATQVAQLRVFAAALDVFVDREALYGDTWTRYGLRDKAGHLKNKLGRIETGLALLSALPPAPNEAERIRADALRESVRDSALDMINYAGFLVRQIEKGTAVDE